MLNRLPLPAFGAPILMTDFGLADKAVIVTGGAGGLGRAFAKGFADAGAHVAVANIDEADAQAAAKALTANGARGIGLAVDITDERSVEQMVAGTRDAFGCVDVLVNNAAIYGAAYRKPFFDISAAEWSASVMSGSPLWLHYVSSKGGLIAMTRALAREMGSDGITVNAIAPGFTLTEASMGAIENAAAYGVERGAIRRAEQPQDVVGAALWFASPHSNFVTGQTVIVDGGRQFH